MTYDKEPHAVLTMEQEWYLASKRIEVRKLDKEQLQDLVMFLMENDLRKHNATVALVGTLMGIPNVTNQRTDSQTL